MLGSGPLIGTLFTSGVSVGWARSRAALYPRFTTLGYMQNLAFRTTAIDDSASTAQLLARSFCRPRTRSRSRSGAGAVTTVNGAGHGGRKASPILLHPHPIKSLSSHPAHSRWRCIFGARIPFPARGREPTAPDPRASVLALLALLALARSCCRGFPPLPPNPRTPFLLTFSSFFLLLTHFSTHHDGTTTVALLRGGVLGYVVVWFISCRAVLLEFEV